MDAAIRRELDDLVARALAEDRGSGDLTAQATVPAGARARATIKQKAPGVVFGLDAAQAVFLVADPAAQVDRLGPEGVRREGGDVLAVEGDAVALLGAERTALNLLQGLSGVATLTARFDAAVDGTRARILDTRKTTPGMRLLEKAAVRAGGAVNHRIGLWDQVLIKENHAAMAGGVGPAVRACLAAHPGVPLEVECRSRAEVDEALEAGAPRLLLDNMTLTELRETVAHVGGRAELEASGNVGLATIREIASTGVDWISVGALTHSAPALDLSLILERLP